MFNHIFLIWITVKQFFHWGAFFLYQGSYLRGVDLLRGVNMVFECPIDGAISLSQKIQRQNRRKSWAKLSPVFDRGNSLSREIIKLSINRVIQGKSGSQ